MKKIRKFNKQNKKLVKKNLRRPNTLFGFLGFSTSNDEEDQHEVLKPKNNLNSIKSSIKNSGRYKSDDDLNKNVFVKRPLHVPVPVQVPKKTYNQKQKVNEKLEKESDQEVNSNMNRLEEEMKKLDQLELKPAKIPVLRNIKISEDLDNSLSKDDNYFIKIVKNENDFDSD